MISRRKFVVVLMLANLATATSTSRPLPQEKRADEQPVRLNTTLIQVPAIVTDRNGSFVADLSQADFTISEDGKRQDISMFAAVKQPFTAVLVLDTSNSAGDRLSAIQNSAVEFTKQLRQADRLMVIAFDNEVRQLTDFTDDQGELERAIKGTESGFGKLLYEAITRALDELKNVEGRRAVILFSDGVDMRSIEATAESSTRMAEETGAVIYVVHFDTRWWIEAEARRQEIEHPKRKTPFDVDGRIPLPPDYGGPDPSPTGIPNPKKPRIEVGGPSGPPVVVNPGDPSTQRIPNEPPDEITATLNKTYGEADFYLRTISSRTGGKVYRADTLADTRSAFSAIANELRNQYLIGYYSKARDGRFHKIKVESARRGIEVRTRPGYRAPQR